MGKSIVCFLICFTMAQPMVVSAARLEKYSVPQPEPGMRGQSDVRARSGSVDEQVYERFKDEIRGYDRVKKDEMEQYFREQAIRAKKDGNKDSVLHYERLIGILVMSK
jgi:hypothetical protein